MSNHINTKLVPPTVSKAILDQLAAEVTEMVQRYDLHGFIFSASISEDDGSAEGGAISTGSVYGCIPHSLVFMARFIASLDFEDLQNFLGYVAELAAERTEKVLAAGVAAVIEEQAAKPTESKAESKLLNMPLPKGKTWQN